MSKQYGIRVSDEHAETLTRLLDHGIISSPRELFEKAIIDTTDTIKLTRTDTLSAMLSDIQRECEVTDLQTVFEKAVSLLHRKLIKKPIVEVQPTPVPEPVTQAEPQKIEKFEDFGFQSSEPEKKKWARAEDIGSALDALLEDDNVMQRATEFSAAQFPSGTGGTDIRGDQ